MIATRDGVANLVPAIKAAEWVAIDTEADSLHAYPEKLCLLQLSLPGTDLLVDPLAGCDLTPVLEALQGKELILHGADYDLRLLHRAFGFVPGSVFDTMWAARLLGQREFGLTDLVRQVLGVCLEKGPQKMNWGVRPLPPRMATYARNDTRYLRSLAEQLGSRLNACGRLEWLYEIGTNLIDQCTRPRPDPVDTLWRIKGSDRLEPRALAVLRELWHWREQEALAANKPPYFVLSHERLIGLSTAVGRGRPVDGLMGHGLSSRRAARLGAAIQKAARLEPTDYPRMRRSTPVRLNEDQKALFDELKRTRDAAADDLAVDPTIIASKADLMRIAQQRPEALGRGLMPWQRRLLRLPATIS